MVNTLLTTAFVILMLKAVITLLFALAHQIQHNKKSKKINHLSYLPEVSVLIAAYNEEIDIADTLESIIDCANLYENGKNFEIIIVDDGSKDKTAEIVASYAKKYNFIRLIKQQNSGKAAALNRAITAARFDIVISIDADSFIDRKTLIHLTKHFNNPQIGAVAGQVKVANTGPILSIFQLIEYSVGQNFNKRSQDIANCIVVIPGAVGAFRKSVVLELGGYSTDTITEDMDLTVGISKLGHKVIFEPLAISWTEVPLSLSSLIKQRVRWMYGTLQVLIKHHHLLFNPRFKSLGMIGLPSIVIFGLMAGIFAPIFDASLIFSGLSSQDIGSALKIFAVVLIADLFVGFFALFLGGDKLSNMFFIVPQRLFFRFFVFYIIGVSLFRMIRGKAVQWDKLKRLGIHSHHIAK